MEIEIWYRDDTNREIRESFWNIAEAQDRWKYLSETKKYTMLTDFP